MVWKTCIYNSEIEISNTGSVRRVFQDDRMDECQREPITLHPYRYGRYFYVNFNNKSYAIHRLVAEHHVPNPDGGTIVAFKDGDVTHFYSDNLKWTNRCDKIKETQSSDNYKQSSGRSKSVYVDELDTEYSNIQECVKVLKSIEPKMNYDTVCRRLSKANTTEIHGFHITLI